MQEGFCEEGKMILIDTLRDARNSCAICVSVGWLLIMIIDRNRNGAQTGAVLANKKSIKAQTNYFFKTFLLLEKQIDAMCVFSRLPSN